MKGKSVWWMALLVGLLLVLSGCIPPVETYTGVVTQRFTSDWGTVLCVETEEGTREITLSDITGYVPSHYAQAETIMAGDRVEAVCQGMDRDGRPFVSKLYVFSETTTAQPAQEATYVPDEPEGIFLEVLSESLTPASAQLRLHNASLAELTCLEGACVQQKIDGVWYDLAVFSEEETLGTAGYELEAGHIMQFTAVWANVCGVLPQGTYRIVQPVAVHQGQRTETCLLAAGFEVI